MKTVLFRAIAIDEIGTPERTNAAMIATVCNRLQRPSETPIEAIAATACSCADDADNRESHDLQCRCFGLIPLGFVGR